MKKFCLGRTLIFTGAISASIMLYGAIINPKSVNMAPSTWYVVLHSKQCMPFFTVAPAMFFCGIALVASSLYKDMQAQKQSANTAEDDI